MSEAIRWRSPTEPRGKGLKSIEGTVGCIRAKMELLADRNGIDNDMVQ